MANEEVLGPRKTMFVLVIVVGCFAVLWPRILSPLMLGPSRDQLKPNQFDREAGCCEVLFDKDMAVLELINEVCSSALHSDGKLTPYTAAECRKAVNETCGVDLAAFLKRSENVGKTSKMLVETMKNSNSSCLKEHFGVHIWSPSMHQAQNSWTLPDTMKQERPIRAGPHPALKERGRAIPPGPPAPSRTIPMPPHVRVRSSPLSVYFELDIKPPPIPGMRPPLGNPGGPLPTPKSSMGFVMPIYTICIIVFFVYTLSKILFKRTGSSPYETVTPDPAFRRRVFRDDSRTTPDKLGPKERDTIVTAISGLVAEVQQQMEASYAQNQQRQDVQDNNTRPYTNGTILHNVGPVHIVASEYREQSKEKNPEHIKEKDIPEENIKPVDEPIPDLKEHPKPTAPLEPTEILPEIETELPEDALITDFDDLELDEVQTDAEQEIQESKESLNLESEINNAKESSQEQTAVENTSELEQDKSLENIFAKNYSEPELVKELTPEPIEDDKSSEKPVTEKDYSPELIRDGTQAIDIADDIHKEEQQEPSPTEVVERETKELVLNGEDATANLIEKSDELLKSIEDLKEQSDGEIRKAEDFLTEEAKALAEENKTVELLEEAIKDEEGEQEEENGSVKVVGMEVTAHVADGGTCLPPAPPAPPAPPVPPAPRHEAEEVHSIFLDTEIPQQSRVLVADFAEDRNDKPVPTKHSPMVVSGKMTLSLIQDAPRDTPERDLESTVDDFTTASAVTQNAAEKGEIQSDEEVEEVEEEIEIEEIEEEVEEEEEEEVEPIEQKK